jgi:multidrug efflux pump subunit AcrB
LQVDLNYKALQAYGLTPYDVVNTINAQNLLLPSGTEKIDQFEYQVGLNSSPPTLEELNAIPIKTLTDERNIVLLRPVSPMIVDTVLPHTALS